MKNSFKVLFLASALAFSGVAHGQLLQTQNFSFTPNGSAVLTFNQVDLDALDVTSIEVTINFDKTGGSLSVDNDSTDSGTISLEHTLSGSLSSSDVVFADGSFQTNWASLEATSSTSASIGATTGDDINTFNNTGDVDFFSYSAATVNETSSAFINSAVYSGYLGTGTYTITFGADQLVNVSGLGGLQQAFTVSQAAGSVTVEVVPEPSTYTLLAALGALGFVVCRRKQVS